MLKYKNPVINITSKLDKMKQMLNKEKKVCLLFQKISQIKIFKNENVTTNIMPKKN